MEQETMNVSRAAPAQSAQPPAIPVNNSGRFTGTHRPPKIYFDAVPCEGPGCTNIIPAGYYAPQRSRSFCSTACGHRDFMSRYLIGTCLHCGGPVKGRKDQVGIKKFCSNEHKLTFETERVLGPTGSFRPLIEEYMRTGVVSMYREGTYPNVRTNLAKFFRFVVQNERVSTLDNIGPAVVTRFIAHEHERGLTGRGFVGHLSTLFGWLISEQRYHKPNPVIPRIHSQRGAPTSARPYSDRDLAAVWEAVENTSNLQLMLAFAIGEECGLRIGEVCNLRLGDFDSAAQTLFVRLPTKNMRTRTVPYHDKVKHYFKLWLAKRDPGCSTDHVFHNGALHCHKGSHLNTWFRNALRQYGEPASAFKFHRLRHTWATRLMNNGMELAVLKELGGWESWNSMQKYIRVLPSTVRTQYESAYRSLQERTNANEEETISLVDFALIAAPAAPSPSPAMT
jgi:integrase